jgi:hypothetical protein
MSTSFNKHAQQWRPYLIGINEQPTATSKRGIGLQLSKPPSKFCNIRSGSSDFPELDLANRRRGPLSQPNHNKPNFGSETAPNLTRPIPSIRPGTRLPHQEMVIATELSALVSSRALPQRPHTSPIVGWNHSVNRATTIQLPVARKHPPKASTPSSYSGNQPRTHQSFKTSGVEPISTTKTPHTANQRPKPTHTGTGTATIPEHQAISAIGQYQQPNPTNGCSPASASTNSHTQPVITGSNGQHWY